MFKRSAATLEGHIKALSPGAQVATNPNNAKPRRGYFEVRVNDAVVFSLPSMPRPFTKLRQADLETVARAVGAALAGGSGAAAASAGGAGANPAAAPVPKPAKPAIQAVKPSKAAAAAEPAGAADGARPAKKVRVR